VIAELGRYDLTMAVREILAYSSERLVQAVIRRAVRVRRTRAANLPGRAP
jgi:hypothetical protein